MAVAMPTEAVAAITTLRFQLVGHRLSLPIAGVIAKPVQWSDLIRHGRQSRTRWSWLLRWRLGSPRTRDVGRETDDGCRRAGDGVRRCRERPFGVTAAGHNRACDVLLAQVHRAQCCCYSGSDLCWRTARRTTRVPDACAGEFVHECGGPSRHAVCCGRDSRPSRGLRVAHAGGCADSAEYPIAHEEILNNRVASEHNLRTTE